MPDKNVVKQVFSLSERVRKEATALDRLPGAALAAVLGGSVVIGWVGGGLFWVPAAMAGGILAYRTVVTALEYPRHRKRRRFAVISDVRKELEEIDRSSMAIEYKHQLIRAVLTEVHPSVELSRGRRALESKSREDDM